MAYSQSDLDSVKSAVLALATGTRVVSVSIGGKRIEYGQTQLQDLRSLKAEIEGYLRAKAGKSNIMLIKTSKGL